MKWERSQSSFKIFKAPGWKVHFAGVRGTWICVVEYRINDVISYVANQCVLSLATSSLSRTQRILHEAGAFPQTSIDPPRTKSLHNTEEAFTLDAGRFFFHRPYFLTSFCRDQGVGSHRLRAVQGTERRVRRGSRMMRHALHVCLRMRTSHCALRFAPGGATSPAVHYNTTQLIRCEIGHKTGYCVKQYCADLKRDRQCLIKAEKQKQN